MGIVKKVKGFLAEKKAKKQQNRASSPNSPSAASDEPADPGGSQTMPTPMQQPSVIEGDQPEYPQARPPSSVYSIPSTNEVYQLQYPSARQTSSAFSVPSASDSIRAMYPIVRPNPSVYSPQTAMEDTRGPPSTISEEASSSSSSEADTISTNLFKGFSMSLEEMQAAHLKRIDNLQLKRTPAMRQPNSASRTHVRQRHIATEPQGVDRMLSYRQPLQETTNNTAVPPIPQRTDPTTRRFAGVQRNRTVLTPARKESYEPSPEEIELVRKAALAKLEGDTKEN